MATMLTGRGTGGRMRTWPTGTPWPLLAASSTRALYSANRATSPLSKSCGPVCGMDWTTAETSTTLLPLSTPSFQSSKKSSFTDSPCALEL